MIPLSEIERLRGLAKAATKPGNYTVLSFDERAAWQKDREQFGAAFDPPTVLAILDQAEAALGLEAAKEASKRLYLKCIDLSRERDAANRQLETLRDQVKRLREGLKPFAERADALSLSHALGHIEREHLHAARALLQSTEPQA